MNRKKVELLAPAGSYETMVGAFNAGADAVYLGGAKFGARAYADNFDREQVLDAISYAHLHGKKIYMTVNTLIKEKEFGEVYDFMLPFAEKNLDGVIVQDYGVMRLIRDEFPNVELHASTQQTVTGVSGARLLKELGCCRVVPARELSLEEMKAIRTEADVEVEAFIHGAMCYCYSGVCLFSSMVGGRSGNRGRCAQPCRLPYQLGGAGKGKEVYPLSLKDMCTIGIIPELIEAGIDSFKIEGRMKKPEYAAGVTSLYRKYIDKYYADPKADIRVSSEDMEILKSLYQRTGISEGYYHKHNGKDMITISSPAYNATSDKVLETVREKYLGYEMKIKCTMECELTLDKPAIISMKLSHDGRELSEKVVGNVVQRASKRPMNEDSVLKQLGRLGNTLFEAEDIAVYIDDNGEGCGIFIPVSELNNLRRSLCEKMENRLFEGLSDKAFGKAQEKGVAANSCVKDEGLSENSKDTSFHILVNTKEQLETVTSMLGSGLDKKAARIYADSDLVLSGDEKVKSLCDSLADLGTELIVALPYVTRKEKFDAHKDLDDIIKQLSDNESPFTGVLIRNLEQLGFFRERHFSGKVILDYGVYVWNKEAALLLKECAKDDFEIAEISVPLELTIHETKQLVKAIRKEMNIPISFNVYGRTPMMVSAGCVKKTLQSCSGKMNEYSSEKLTIVDRMGNVLPVVTKCRNCYNVIWNAHPTSLCKKLNEIMDMHLFDNLRIDFSVEKSGEIQSVLRAFLNDDKESLSKMADQSFTTGHYKREVE